MESNGPSGRVTSGTTARSGEIDRTGDVVDELTRRLRPHIGPVHEERDPVDPDGQARLVAVMVTSPELFRGTVVAEQRRLVRRVIP